MSNKTHCTTDESILIVQLQQPWAFDVFAQCLMLHMIVIQPKNMNYYGIMYADSIHYMEP